MKSKHNFCIYRVCGFRTHCRPQNAITIERTTLTSLWNGIVTLFVHSSAADYDRWTHGNQLQKFKDPKPYDSCRLNWCLYAFTWSRRLDSRILIESIYSDQWWICIFSLEWNRNTKIYAIFELMSTLSANKRLLPKYANVHHQYLWASVESNVRHFLAAKCVVCKCRRKFNGRIFCTDHLFNETSRHLVGRRAMTETLKYNFWLLYFCAHRLCECVCVCD